MNVSEAVLTVASKFVYRFDKKILFDYWMVMKEQDGFLYGDCDDFALTSIWKICDDNLLKFFLNVFILHKYRLYFALTKTKEKHMVGYAEDLWFDNWSKKALSKEEFLERTGHKIYFFFPSPLMVIPMLIGLIMRNNNRK